MVKIAVGQIRSTNSKTHNLQKCLKLVKRAKAGDAKALFLPEASDYISSSAKESAALAESLEESDFVDKLRGAARDNEIAINVGVHAPSFAGPNGRVQSSSNTDTVSKVKNLLIWIDPQGNIQCQYTKVHMFNVDMKGGPQLRESDAVEAGTVVGDVVDTKIGIGKVGLAICFDMRFPEVSLSLRRRGADIIVFPSAFTVETGKAHWHTLLRARAIESQCYVVAAAQSGKHNDKRVSYGHSIVVSPWGDILAESPGIDNVEDAAPAIHDENDDELKEPSILIVDIDIDYVAKVRESLPLWEMRRSDVYPEI